MIAGVGIVTYRRPEFFQQCAASVMEHLSWVNWIGAYHDGPDPGGYEDSPIPVVFGQANGGVAVGKNWLLRSMLAVPVDWCCLLEDDIAVDSPMAVTGYVAACHASRYEHLNFAHHGRRTEPLDTDRGVSFWDNYSGAYSVTSRRAIEQVGLLDEAFVNAYEHAEWTLRMAYYGFTSGWRRCADATGSEDWLHEQPGAHEGSVIATLAESGANAVEGREHWRIAHPETFPWPR